MKYLFFILIMCSCAERLNKTFDNSFKDSGIVFPIIGSENESNKLKKNYYIVFDNSGSMSSTGCRNQKESKEDIAKKAVLTFVSSIPSEDNVGMVIFDGDTSERVSLISDDKLLKIKEALEKSSNGGSTPLEKAMKIGVEKLAIQAGKQGGYGEYHLVVVTDGDADSDLSSIVNEIVYKTPIVINTMGFCLNRHVLNQPDKTIYKQAGNYEELREGLKEILSEAKNFQGTNDFDDIQ